MKRIATVFMLLCLLLTMLPLGAFATETVEATEETAAEADTRTYNQCGADLIWQFDGSTLTISGTGEMDHYPDGDTPWLEYKDNIETLVFTGGVTSVGDCAFMDYDSIQKVDFGTAMHTIGYRAFKSCDGLTTFTLPSTFRKFGEECFFGCTRLREVRCLGGMPSFKASCLWDCPVSVFYPTTNPWPAEYVTPLYQSYQGKIQIFMGDGIEEAGVQPGQLAEAQPAMTEPAETVPETTVPETTVPETTVPETTVPETTVPETEPEMTEAATEAPETEPTEPEWLRETQPQEPEKKSGGINGALIAVILISGTLTLILIGALLFRRRY